VLPLELVDSGLFGDGLQLAPSFIVLYLNLWAARSSYGELEEWKWLDDPEESPNIAGVVAGAGAGFQWMNLENIQRIVRNKKKYGKSY
jgi:hypothetical protein